MWAYAIYLGENENLLKWTRRMQKTFDVSTDASKKHGPVYLIGHFNLKSQEYTHTWENNRIKLFLYNTKESVYGIATTPWTRECKSYITL